MRDKIKNRIEELKNEYKLGQERLTELERQISGIRETMLRISGAIQVLEEMDASEEKEENTDS
ncbi:MAG: hypothetical protein N2645_14115 [Clostridia bacterium]|nr:hypothetical protein [Clostridia bacterium]